MLGMDENSVPGCCGKRVPSVSVTQGFRTTSDCLLEGGLPPLVVFLLSFPLYATFVSVYLVFVLLSSNKSIPADAKPLSPIKS